MASSSVFSSNKSAIDPDPSVIGGGSGGGGGVVTDYQNFYEFGDSGLGYTDDTAGNDNLTDDNTTQFDDPTQGFVATTDASPVDQSMVGMGAIAGAVDKTYTFVFKADTVGDIILAKEGSFNNYFRLTSATEFQISTASGSTNYAIPTISTGTFYHGIVTITSGLMANIYINNVVSTSGAQTIPALVDIDSMFNYTSGTSFDWLGAIAKVRSYPRIITAGERALIFATDLKS